LASALQDNTAPIQSWTAGSAAFHGGAKKVIRRRERFMEHRDRNEEDYLQHFEYMRLNPYKHQSVNDKKRAMAMVVRT